VFFSRTTAEKATQLKLLEVYVSSVQHTVLVSWHDHIHFLSGYVLPIIARAIGLVGMRRRPRSKMNCTVFYEDGLAVYSITLHREHPDTTKNLLRRTLFEGLVRALAMKPGRRPAIAQCTHGAPESGAITISRHVSRLQPRRPLPAPSAVCGALLPVTFAPTWPRLWKKPRATNFAVSL